MNAAIHLTYVGGPTALIEVGGLRLLTDPTFDPAGTRYEAPGYTLVKTQAPAVPAGDVGRVDAVLLSHDHHFDNLDRAGRDLLPGAGRVLTTRDGAERLGGGAVGMSAWDETELGGSVRVTATPARHGPADGDRGPVIGFVVAPEGGRVLYISGDTVFYEGVEEVARRFAVDVAVLNLGAARVAAAGPHPLTLTGAEAVEVARAMPSATIVPLHFEGWEHFSEPRAEAERAFADAGLTERVAWPEPGRPLAL
jgi:L-ascorbate metabolism protein UlaG (beta-lactamase superfamily)